VSHAPDPAVETSAARGNTRLYIGVIAVEILVLVGIWLFQLHFGS